MFEGVILYLIILIIYIPWLFFVLRNNNIVRFPIISFCGIGMVFFNAIGSIFVIFPNLFGRLNYVYSPFQYNYFSYEYILLLIIQAILFYFIISFYFLIIKKKSSSKFIYHKKADWVFLYFLLILISIIIVFYFRNVGNPALIELIKGSISGSDIVKHRVTTTYGLRDYSLYNLGFDVLPIITSVYAFTMILSKKRGRLLISNYLIILVCIIILILHASKGGPLKIILALVIAYILFCAKYSTFKPNKTTIRNIVLIVLIVVVIPTVLMYQFYYPNFTTISIFVNLVDRVFVVNSQSLAATVIYTRTYGFLYGCTFPNIRGLLKFERVDLSKVMHLFMYGPGGGAPISAFAEGYLNFGWIGFILMTIAVFITIILVEDLFKKISKNLLSFSLLVQYSICALNLSVVSFFATFCSLILVSLFVLLIVLRFMLLLIFNLKKYKEIIIS